MQFILNIQRSTESILLGLTDRHAAFLVGMFSVLTTLHKALAFTHLSVPGISTSVAHERSFVAFKEGIHSLLLLVENVPIFACSIFSMRRDRLVEVFVAVIAL